MPIEWPEKYRVSVKNKRAGLDWPGGIPGIS